MHVSGIKEIEQSAFRRNGLIGTVDTDVSTQAATLQGLTPHQHGKFHLSQTPLDYRQVADF